MPLDPNIILGLKPPQIDSPLNALAQIAQLQAHQQQAQLGALQLQQGRQAMADDQTLRDTLRLNGGNMDAAIPELYKQGAAKQAQALQLHLEDIKNKRATAEKLHGEAVKSSFEAWQIAANQMADTPDKLRTVMLKMSQDPMLAGYVSPVDPQGLQTAVPDDPEGFQKAKDRFVQNAKDYAANLTAQQGHLLTAQTAANAQAGSDRRAMWTAGATIGAQGIDPRSILSSLGAPVPGAQPGMPAPGMQPQPNQLVNPSAPTAPARVGPSGRPALIQPGDADMPRILQNELAQEQARLVEYSKPGGDPEQLRRTQVNIEELGRELAKVTGRAPPLPVAQPAAGVVSQPDSGPKLLPGMMPLVDRIGRGDATFEKGTEGMHPLVKGLVQTELEARYPQPDMSLTGEAFLKTLPPGQAAQVKMMAEGKIPVTAQTQRSPEGARLLQMAAQYEPGTDATIYQSRFATAKDAASGKLATSNNALNTVAGHLAGLAQAAEALNNTSFPWVNEVKNFVETASGDPRVNTFNTNLNGVVDELERAYRGAGGSEGSIRLWRQNLGDASSPEQFREVLKKAAEMVQSKLEANQAQYEQGMHGKPGDHRSITPAAEAAFSRLMGRSASTTQSGLQGAIEAELAKRRAGK